VGERVWGAYTVLFETTHTHVHGLTWNRTCTHRLRLRKWRSKYARSVGERGGAPVIACHSSSVPTSYSSFAPSSVSTIGGSVGDITPRKGEGGGGEGSHQIIPRWMVRQVQTFVGGGGGGWVQVVDGLRGELEEERSARRRQDEALRVLWNEVGIIFVMWFVCMYVFRCHIRMCVYVCVYVSMYLCTDEALHVV